MRVLIDTNALIYLLNPNTPRSLADRMKGLLEDIESSRGRLIIPAQVVGEYISGAGPAGEQILSRLAKSRSVEIASFDHVAATECALMERVAIATGNKRAPLARNAIWQKVKVDRQIVAIAKVRSVDLIVSSDGDIPTLAEALALSCVRVEDLALPQWAMQMSIDEAIKKPTLVSKVNLPQSQSIPAPGN
jgi:predicted nucleic acid-binding protein